MYCQNCGAANEEGAKFCANCGTTLGPATPTDQPGPLHSYEQQPQEQQPHEPQPQGPSSYSPVSQQPPVYPAPPSYQSPNYQTGAYQGGGGPVGGGKSMLKNIGIGCLIAIAIFFFVGISCTRACFGLRRNHILRRY